MELRARAMAWAARRRAQGDGPAALAQALGVSTTTVRRWSQARSAVAPVALRRVEVIEEAPAERTLTLVAPTGMRIEGLTVATAIAILRGLA